MKRFAVLLIAVAIVGFAGQAWAGVQGSAHDVASLISSAKFGTCSACHIPHKSFGARLWPVAVTGTDPLRGDVGALCGYCHDAGGVIGVAAQTQVFKDVEINTHGLTKASLPGGDTLDANLPYTGAAAGALIQCTSCHNVHDQTAPRNAFLQDDIDVLCSRCHQRRQFVGGAAATTQGAWGTFFGWNATPANGNPGSHPIGTDITGDISRHDVNGDGTATDPDSPVVTGVLGIVAYGVQGDYQLGAHLINGGLPADAATFTGGIACVTCHAVHGGDIGNNAPGAFAPNPDLLVMNQSEMNSAANGNTDPANALCEGCHRNAASRMGSTLYYPNPGATAGAHPVDDAYNLADAGVTAATITALGWPLGDGADNGGDADIICESCHMPHPLAAMNGSQGTPVPVLAGSNSHILRDTDVNICSDCHTGQLADHHPIGNGLMDGTLFDDDIIGDADTNMECSDCHNGNGAHNWTDIGIVGLDPDWEPRNNARDATNDAVGRAVTDMSKECVDCHFAASTRFSPTRPETPNANEYQDGANMDASHFLGVPTVTLNTWPAGMTDGTAIPGGGTFVSDTWASTGWSRFGGTTGAVAATSQMVCESCHELEPGKNATGSDLLLHAYQEALAEDRSYFCQGCHGPTGVATGNAHPQTGDDVGRASLAGRDGLGNASPLRTTPLTGAGASFAELGDRGATWYPAANQMNCNTCHQPHDAVNSSGTYILESTTGTALAEPTGTPDTAVTMGTKTWAAKRYVTHATPLNYQNFCNLCHQSGM